MRQSPRLTLLHKLKRFPHRYRVIRAATISTSLAILFAVPLTGLARFDAWGGEHLALGEKVSGVHGTLAVLVGIVVLYIFTFVLNLFLGRLFCGWGCPIAQINRYGEDLERSGAGEVLARKAYVYGGAYSALLSIAVMLWWVSPRVVTEGSALALSITFGVLIVLVTLAFLHGRYWRWKFCTGYCPIGLYYSVVTPRESWGVVFDNTEDQCKMCNLCERICPVGLDSRDLSRPQESSGGLSIDGQPGTSHCLRCGDFVLACEWVFRKESEVESPVRFGTPRAEENQPR